MSVKQAVFEFIEKHPEFSLDQVVAGLTEHKRASVRKYYYDYKKLGTGETDKQVTRKKAEKKQSGKAKTGAEQGSIRNKVYALLSEDPNRGIDDLCQKITGSNRKTIRDYRNRWRKEHPQGEPAGNAEEAGLEAKKFAGEKKAVYSYMMQHPEANLNDLRKQFPDNKKLVTDFRSWKHQQPKNQKQAHQATDEPLTTDLSALSYRKTIQSMKKVIEKQKVTIETQRQKLKQVRQQLTRSSKFSLDGIKSFLSDKIFNK
ncbi:MAG: hypothetical protein ABIK68_16790 [bacterium]